MKKTRIMRGFLGPQIALELEVALGFRRQTAERGWKLSRKAGDLLSTSLLPPTKQLLQCHSLACSNLKNWNINSGFAPIVSYLLDLLLCRLGETHSAGEQPQFILISSLHIHPRKILVPHKSSLVVVLTLWTPGLFPSCEMCAVQQ